MALFFASHSRLTSLRLVTQMLSESSHVLCVDESSFSLKKRRKKSLCVVRRGHTLRHGLFVVNPEARLGCVGFQEAARGKTELH